MPVEPAGGQAQKPPVKKVDVGPDPLGMEEPFFNLGPTGWKTLKAGWRAMGKKQYSEAREAFAAVVSAYPDHTEVRFQELRAAVLDGDLRGGAGAVAIAAGPGLRRLLGPAGSIEGDGVAARFAGVVRTAGHPQPGRPSSTRPGWTRGCCSSPAAAAWSRS